MLFNLDSDFALEDFFNINENKSEILDPKDGLALGNMFLDSYIPYKNYKPHEYKPCGEKEKLLLRIQELSFALNDLNLHLDINPENKDYYYLFKTYADELKCLKKQYSNEYESLELDENLKSNYTWYQNPWPWEGDN